MVHGKVPIKVIISSYREIYVLNVTRLYINLSFSSSLLAPRSPDFSTIFLTPSIKSFIFCSLLLVSSSLWNGVITLGGGWC